MSPSALAPLWEVLNNLVLPEPSSPAKVHRWHYAEARDYLMRAGDLISAREAERRVLILKNPGLGGEAAITRSLYAGLQLVLPGEVAPCHRHSQSALRFVLEGTGAFTAVDGEKAIMRPYDLVLTPGGQWHDHGNTSEQPVIWLDGLDIPTVTHFDASFAERLGEDAHPQTRPAGDTLARYGRNMRPLPGSMADTRPAGQALFHYPYAEWRGALSKLAETKAPDPHDGYALEFFNPATGGPIMPTISAQAQMLPAGLVTRPRRASAGAVIVVVEGSGELRIGDETMAVEPRDIIAVPAWKPLVIDAWSDLTLFAFSDRAAQQALNIYREHLA
ncbi:gentisate 1,2-dioxygenase [Novosphingobium kaempferiae]|uniref:gentisate 1,2-dioxygenase n=1 Tax=Novosphingobium kaempferiae TaxID=2896849 RepID=UPI001E6440E9|nr:gentisate 1,2-dioxygenase [Novosphingobium kaempferiae]